MEDKDRLLYYRQEIDYLLHTRELFIKNFPKLAPFLSHDSKDPDIERLIENLALLTSKIRQEMDQNIPTIAESLINIISPNYTSPIPSVSMQEFSLSPNCSEKKIFIPKGTKLKSEPIDGVACSFKTIYDVHLYPLKISDLFVTTAGNKYALSIKTTLIHKNTLVSDLGIDRLNLFLGLDIYLSTTLLMWIFNHLEKIVLIPVGKEEEFRIPNDSIAPIGFSEDESIFYGRNSGAEAFQLMQEFFFIPDKFNFVSIKNLDILSSFKTEGFSIKLVFNKEIPPLCIPRKENINFFITPIVNLFETSAEPIINNNQKDGYRIFIDRTKPHYYEILDILKVQASSTKSGRRLLKNYKSFERFEFFENKHLSDFYSIANKYDSQGNSYREISFFLMDPDRFDIETISIETLCCNKNLPMQLKIGQINQIEKIFADVMTKNITIPTKMHAVQIDGQLLWRLVSVLSLNYQTIIDRKSFLSVLQAYDFTIQNEDADNISKRLSQGITDIKSKSIYRITNGISKKGILCLMFIDEEKFYGIGEIYRFGLVVSRFLSFFASTNSFCELQIFCQNTRQTIEFNPCEGIKSTI
ncbi:type VI secretion protein [Helicobacter sp. 12S02232-10]|uniref:type VI secretion system baseplate subunit TssF n=1 Tax=Helicobacter sp. 12S02232-10 TaxID=1476197 RepID=UPI000BA658C3|nr:type VI secretion system baseplate subunit TssF [Helicobacter sp. 12S02232-10]PAF49741.1 type VI secretion protein [Helicobacter sp. 12S02232-10]